MRGRVWPVSFFAAPDRRREDKHSPRGGIVKFALLIYSQPGAWEGLLRGGAERDLRRVHGDLGGPRGDRRETAATGVDGNDRPRPGWKDADNGRPVRRHEGGARPLLPVRGRRP